MKSNPNKKDRRINVITLGCSKNLVDSENLVTQLAGSDLLAEHETEQESDVVVVNTCGFIESAKEESINTILEQVALKKQGKLQEVYVTGCLSERYQGDLSQEIDEVDGWFGTTDLPALVKELGADYRHELIGERLASTPLHYAYLKISEGCNRTCSFCAIPLMRGKHISRPIEELVQEAKNLAAKGVRELMLIAQELTYYGLDLYKDRKLPELLHALADVEGIEWIRLHYAYPAQFPIEIADAIAARDEVCNYLDIPLQHAADPVLQAMKRQTTRKEQGELIKEIRNRVPGIAIRTTMLVGFPGETELDFEELVDFVREHRFERLGVFTYSHEEGTSGFDLEDDVPAAVKESRAARLMEVQQEISFELNRDKVGRVLRVLIDRKEGQNYVGRSEFDSPEVDNEVVISSPDNYLRVGDFYEVKITDATEFDLFAEIVS
jgi:ribosomal protein S12 methylthiotransferase